MNSLNELVSHGITVLLNADGTPKTWEGEG